MAGETILVVDDSAVNLKLAAAVLRGDGYRVLLATSAEQALMTLRTTLPELVLVDIQLPGMNGLELARCIREDARTRKLVIVALTATTTHECEQQAYDAGCDGFLAKPIDTRTLGPRLRNFLEGTSLPAEPAVNPPASPAVLPLEGPEMESLRRSFLVDGLRQVRRMLEFAGSELDPTAAARQFHQWTGSAGALGYSDLAEQSHAAETLLQRPGWTQSDLRQVLQNLAQSFSSPREAADTPIPQSVARELEGKRMALVGFADEEAERVCVAFGKVRALPLLLPADEPPASNSFRECSVVMVHVRPENHGTPWLQPDFCPVHPLVLVGRRDDLLALPAAVQSRACEFLIDGWQPEEVVMRLSFAIARSRQDLPSAAESSSASPGILVVDDDPNVLAVVRATLEKLGMECRTATNGPDALELIRQRSPQAVVLDVNMPEMDGFAVLATIRQSAPAVKVVLLTARQHERDVLRGFELGAGDYVVKPFNPLELAARLKRLL